MSRQHSKGAERVEPWEPLDSCGSGPLLAYLLLSPSRVLRGKLSLLLQLSLSLLPLPHPTQRTREARTGCILLLEAEAVCEPERVEKRRGLGRREVKEGTGVGLGHNDDRWKGMEQVQRRLMMLRTMASEFLGLGLRQSHLEKGR